MLPSIFFKSLNISRSALYFAESLPLGVVAKFITGENRKEFQDKEKLKNLVNRLDQLLNDDSDRFAKGDYPLTLLKPGSPLQHAKSYLDVLVDSLFVARRMKRKNSKDFPKEVREEIEGMPEYFQRNFHFQSGGYFSRSSAKRYEHQVNILFSGSTDAMRRQCFLPMIGDKDKRFKALEIACGQGGATRQFIGLFPKAHLVASDISSAYLQEAKDQLSDHSRVDFIQAQGEKLPFKDEEFEVVFHVYLFHELPLAVRREVMQEALRVLKPGGRLIVGDSLQLGDDPNSDWALKEFPQRYHEPFYTNYIKTPLKDLFVEAGFEEIEESHQFLTKSVTGIKPKN